MQGVLWGLPVGAPVLRGAAEAKRANVADALARTARLGAERAEELVLPCIPSKRTWGYRNKLEMGRAPTRRGGSCSGFTARAPTNWTRPASCPLAHACIARAPKALQGALRFAQGAQDLGIFRVGVRGSLRTHDVEVALWTRPGPFPRTHVARMMKSALRATSVVRVLADPGRARAVKGVEALEGRGWWEEDLAGARLGAAAPSFFQVNTAQAERLVEDACAGLGGGDALAGAFVADLYAGVGTFSVSLARLGADVVAVESSGPAVRDLRRNAERNGVDVEVVGGDAARELPDLGELDFLVVDPPRAGLAKGVVEDIARAAPARVAYVSCDVGPRGRATWRASRRAGTAFRACAPWTCSRRPTTWRCRARSSAWGRARPPPGPTRARPPPPALRFPPAPPSGALAPAAAPLARLPRDVVRFSPVGACNC